MKCINHWDSIWEILFHKLDIWIVHIGDQIFHGIPLFCWYIGKIRLCDVAFGRIMVDGSGLNPTRIHSVATHRAIMGFRFRLDGHILAAVFFD